MGHKLECEKKEWKQHDHLNFLNSQELISITEVPNVDYSRGYTSLWDSEWYKEGEWSQIRGSLEGKEQ
jgi:hypothetical protein